MPSPCHRPTLSATFQGIPSVYDGIAERMVRNNPGLTKTASTAPFAKITDGAGVSSLSVAMENFAGLSDLIRRGYAVRRQAGVLDVCNKRIECAGAYYLGITILRAPDWLMKSLFHFK